MSIKNMNSHIHILPENPVTSPLVGAGGEGTRHAERRRRSGVYAGVGLASWVGQEGRCALPPVLEMLLLLFSLAAVYSSLLSILRNACARCFCVRSLLGGGKARGSIELVSFAFAWLYYFTGLLGRRSVLCHAARVLVFWR